MSKLQHALNRIYHKGPRPWGEDRASRRRRLAEEVPVAAPAGQPDDRRWHTLDDHLDGCPTIEYVIDRVGGQVRLLMTPSLEVGWSVDGDGTYTFRKTSVYGTDGRDKVLRHLSPADVQPFRDVLAKGRLAWVDVMREAADHLAGVGKGTSVVDSLDTVAAFVRFDVGLDAIAQVDATLEALEDDKETEA